MTAPNETEQPNRCPEDWPSAVHAGPHTCGLPRGHEGMHRCSRCTPEPLPCAAEVYRICTQLQDDGMKPVAVRIPGRDPWDGVPGTMFGIPVEWTEPPGEVQVVVSTNQWIPSPVDDAPFGPYNLGMGYW